jgi:protein-tyrosine phosphatase
MASILVVCSGNICRSPIAEGLLRRAIGRRFGEGVPSVSSAGTIAFDGNLPSEGSVTAAAERGVDIAAHRATALTDAAIRAADLCVCMAAEHRDEIALRVPSAAGRAFTLKELVRLLEATAPAAPTGPETLPDRVGEAATVRADRGTPNPFDEDVVDPLGMPLDTYRAVAWELDEWVERLARALYGPVPVAAEGR